MRMKPVFKCTVPAYRGAIMVSSWKRQTLRSVDQGLKRLRGRPSPGSIPLLLSCLLIPCLLQLLYILSSFLNIFSLMALNRRTPGYAWNGVSVEGRNFMIMFQQIQVLYTVHDRITKLIRLREPVDTQLRPAAEIKRLFNLLFIFARRRLYDAQSSAKRWRRSSSKKFPRHLRIGNTITCLTLSGFPWQLWSKRYSGKKNELLTPIKFINEKESLGDKILNQNDYAVYFRRKWYCYEISAPHTNGSMQL